MKKLFKLFGLIGLAVGLICSSQAQLTGDWNDAWGLGNPQDNWTIEQAGVNLAVIVNVRSNTLWTATSARSSGAPVLNDIWLKPDLVTGTLDFWVATNVYTLASNATIGTNIIWLNATNSGLATNDVLLLRDITTDSYQLVLLGGGATTASGLVITNALGYNAVKLWNTTSNAIPAGGLVYKMRQFHSLTPLTMQNVTNDVAAPWGNWWQLATRAAPIQFSGPLAVPTAVTLTYSNAAGLKVGGSYVARPRRY